METKASLSPSGPDKQGHEISPETEITIRLFNPENPKDILQLHKIDLATRNTTTDVTGAKNQISDEDLRGWMEDPMLFALENKGKVFGSVWFTEDPDNPQETPEVKNFLIQHAYKGRVLVELSHGELPNTPESQVIAGLKASIFRLTDGLGSTLLPVITAYTTDKKGSNASYASWISDVRYNSSICDTNG
jgi:hypothetical protein